MICPVEASNRNEEKIEMGEGQCSKSKTQDYAEFSFIMRNGIHINNWIPMYYSNLKHLPGTYGAGT